MKHGILIYQSSAWSVGLSYDYDGRLLGMRKEDKFLKNLRTKLSELNYPVTVELDHTDADLEMIASSNYDFIVSIPGLQTRLFF